MSTLNDGNSSNGQDIVSEEAVNMIRMYLPEYIPSTLKSKPFYEIARYQDKDGNYTGLAGLKQAWMMANNSIMNNDLFSSDEGAKLRKLMIDLASLSSGSGLSDTQVTNFMTGFDKYGKSMLMPNLEMSGLTFISRPRLCLQSSNIRNNPIMAPLDTYEPNSMAFAIRALLDTNLDNPFSANQSIFSNAIDNSPLINRESPWLTPLSNALRSITGFPDLQLQDETTDGGWFSEQQRYVSGFDNFNRGTTLTLTFREMPGGSLSALFFYWLEYIRCVVRGDMLAYPDDIDGQILNYTVSIYSFNMDPSMQYITRWVKCTGCYPVSLAVGTFMNKSEGSFFKDETRSFSVSFVVNKVEYMKPYCLQDFNTLAKRYCPNIDCLSDGRYVSTRADGRPVSDLKNISIPDSAFSNFCGLPYIISDQNGYRLVYRESSKGMFADPLIRKLIACDIARTEVEWTYDGRSSYSLYQEYDYADFYNKDVKNVKTSPTNGISGVMDFDKLIMNISNGTFLRTN